jgi:hypothetical protein
VNVLDENIFESQRAQLQKWRIRASQIGDDLGRKGMADDEILPLLQTMRHPTFFSRDFDFFDKSLCNVRLCLAYLDVKPLDTAEYIRRFLRHADFKTWAQREGCVVRVAASGISVWRLHARRVVRHRWTD